MDKTYENQLAYLKALADPNRLMIVEMLSAGELCACSLLEGLEISQPTLSHHMRILCECGLVFGRPVGKWMYYSLNEAAINELIRYLGFITTAKIASAS